MTVHDLHDALNLLPGDLITATDKLRAASKPRVIRWRRWVSMAACLVLILSVGLVFRRKILPGMGGSTEAAAQAPAAMSADMAETFEPGAIEYEEGAAEAAPQEVPAEEKTQSSLNGAVNEQPAGESMVTTDGDHTHRYADTPETVDDPVSGYCGNTLTTIYLAENTFTIAGSDSIAVTDILINLDYEPDEVCRCMAQFTVDTEMLTGIEVNLAEGFARCEKGQASLTEEQAKTIQEIIDGLE